MKEFPGAEHAGDAPLCCISTMGKELSFEINKKSNTTDIIAVFNTDDIDSDDEVVVPSGLDPTYFKANGKIFSDHIYSTQTTIGFLRWLKEYPTPQDHRQWRARVGIHSTDLGRDIMTIAQESGQFGFSIGFWPEDYGQPTPDEVAKYTQGTKIPRSITRTGNWFETSATPFPCNVTCQGKLVISASAEESSKSILEGLLRKGSIMRSTAAQYGLTTEKRKAFRIAYEDGTSMAGFRND